MPGPMPISTVLRAKRALVSILLQLASFYTLDVDLVRESHDDAVLSAYRRVAKKAHPDKGGQKKQFQKQQAAKDAWDSARQPRAQAGNPHLTPGKLVVRSAAAG